MGSSTSPDVKGLVARQRQAGHLHRRGRPEGVGRRGPGEPGPTRTFIELGLRVLDTLEALPFPTVALIDGAALGGGLEVALACDFRLCGTSPKVQLGLPEIKLGLVPGWGGTQRLPRLVGVEEAINRLLSGESYDATDPPPEDLVDETVPSDELDAAGRSLAFDRRLARGPGGEAVAGAGRSAAVGASSWPRRGRRST